MPRSGPASCPPRRCDLCCCRRGSRRAPRAAAPPESARGRNIVGRPRATAPRLRQFHRSGRAREKPLATAFEARRPLGRARRLMRGAAAAAAETRSESRFHAWPIRSPPPLGGAGTFPKRLEAALPLGPTSRLTPGGSESPRGRAPRLSCAVAYSAASLCEEAHSFGRPAVRRSRATGRLRHARIRHARTGPRHDRLHRALRASHPGGGADRPPQRQALPSASPRGSRDHLRARRRARRPPRRGARKRPSLREGRGGLRRAAQQHPPRPFLRDRALQVRPHRIRRAAPQGRRLRPRGLRDAAPHLRPPDDARLLHDPGSGEGSGPLDVSELRAARPRAVVGGRGRVPARNRHPRLRRLHRRLHLVGHLSRPPHRKLRPLADLVPARLGADSPRLLHGRGSPASSTRSSRWAGSSPEAFLSTFPRESTTRGSAPPGSASPSSWASSRRSASSTSPTTFRS